MFRKTMIALFATLVLVASFSAANAQRGCVDLGDAETNSAFPAHSLCR